MPATFVFFFSKKVKNQIKNNKNCKNNNPAKNGVRID